MYNAGLGMDELHSEAQEEDDQVNNLADDLEALGLLLRLATAVDARRVAAP